MASLCHPWFTTTNFSYRFPIFETSDTALCGTTGKNNQNTLIYCIHILSYQSIIVSYDPNHVCAGSSGYWKSCRGSAFLTVSGQVKSYELGLRFLHLVRWWSSDFTHVISQSWSASWHLSGSTAACPGNGGRSSFATCTAHDSAASCKCPTCATSYSTDSRPRTGARESSAGWVEQHTVGGDNVSSPASGRPNAAADDHQPAGCTASTSNAAASTNSAASTNDAAACCAKTAASTSRTAPAAVAGNTASHDTSPATAHAAATLATGFCGTGCMQ